MGNDRMIIVLPVRFRKASTTVALLCCSVGTAATAGAQCPPPVPNYFVAGSYSTDPPTVTVTVPSTTPTCTVPDGGYLALNTMARFDVAASVTGTCHYYNWCTFYNNQMRYLDVVAWSQVSPSQVIPSFYASLGYPNIDTTQWPAGVGGGGSQSLSWGTPGTYELQFVTRAMPTSCNIPTDSTTVARTINVLKCGPKWSVDSNGNIQHLRPVSQPDTISVYLDPTTFGGTGTTIANALDSAISNWNSQVGASGISLARVTSACTTGPKCVTVQAADLGTSQCGYTPAPITDSTGDLTGDNLYIQINSNTNADWHTWNSASLQRTFAHELGHLLGLGDYATLCDSSGDSAVMQPNFYCSSVASPLTTPSLNDYLPINNTVYGGRTRIACGY